MKNCFKCNQEKPRSEFYAHKQMGDGLLGKCKECTRADTKKRSTELMEDPKWKASEQARHREKYHRLEYREKHKPTYEAKKIIIGRWNDKFPEKMAANGGKKIRVAGKQCHHWSYKPEHKKDVLHLTKEQHYTLHRFLTYDQSEFQYRDVSGNILDTREKHEAYAAAIFKAHQ